MSCRSPWQATHGTHLSTLMNKPEKNADNDTKLFTYDVGVVPSVGHEEIPL